MKRKPNNRERAELVLAMERLARAVNDEEVFDYWLSMGVADGDIDFSESHDDLVNQISDDDWYVRDEDFSELMRVFLNLMTMARKSGGLYEDGVVSK